jgi:drug/metabolite transporter (DMT)-like permease
MRRLGDAGLHALWTTSLAFTLAALAIVLARPAAPRLLAGRRGLWVLVVASGATNAAFNWAVTIGDVVRVVLLFYLMPVWAVVLARLLVGERLTGASAARIALGVAGAAIVLWPGGEAATAPTRSTLLPDALAVAGGFFFALNNVMLRRHAREPGEARALAMFLGGAVVAAAIAVGLGIGGAAPWPPAPAPAWLAGVVAMAGLFLVGNLALQVGAARLPAQVTAVVMLTEIVFASASALLLGGGTATARMAFGGALIVVGALLAATGRGADPERLRSPSAPST